MTFVASVAERTPAVLTALACLAEILPLMFAAFVEEMASRAKKMSVAMVYLIAALYLTSVASVEVITPHVLTVTEWPTGERRVTPAVCAVEMVKAA